jgi:hypothetical protein
VWLPRKLYLPLTLHNGPAIIKGISHSASLLIINEYQDALANYS